MNRPATAGWEVRRAEARDAAAVSELFHRAGVPCFCQYYDFAGDHREWQNRCANDRAENERRLRADLHAERMSAVLAVAPGEMVIGWARIAKAAHMSKLYENRLYRALPVLAEGDRTQTYAVACFLVDPEYRRQGVARQLLEGALRLALSLSASAIEAFPRGATDVSDGEQWTGPKALYEDAGFERVSDFEPYPVYRKILTS